MAKDTKERILDAALEIFARDGYAGTNIKDIADAVGIVKSALYKHFAGKEDIWNATFARMSEYYDEHFGSAEKLKRLPGTTEELYQMTMQMLRFTMHDRRVILCRKIIMIEQYRTEEMQRFATRYFIDDTQAIFARVFSGMMEAGTLRQADPDTLALAYSAPITVLVHMCDRQPEREAEAMERIERLLRQFIDTYGLPQST